MITKKTNFQDQSKQSTPIFVYFVLSKFYLLLLSCINNFSVAKLLLSFQNYSISLYNIHNFKRNILFVQYLKERDFLLKSERYNFSVLIFFFLVELYQFLFEYSFDKLMTPSFQNEVGKTTFIKVEYLPYTRGVLSCSFVRLNKNKK